MIYENIQGWFNYEDLYAIMIERFNNALFVEIGTWKGRSTAYMAEKIRDSKKRIKFVTIDHFKGNPESKLHASDMDIINGTLYETFIENITPLKDYVTIIKGDSNEVSRKFKDKSIDFLFIDGSHTFEAVSSDIKLWKPKVKTIIAGHDYHFPGVNSAVKQLVPDHKIMGDVWYAEY